MKKYFLFLLTAAALVGCSKNDIVELNTLNLSGNSFTFDAAGKTTHTVTVESNDGDWAFAETIDWLTVDRSEDGNTLTLTTTANETTDALDGKITISNRSAEREITVTQLGKSEPGAPKFRVLTDFTSFTLSPGGKMALGVRMLMADDTGFVIDNSITVIDLATDEETELTPINGVEEEYSAGAISDDGNTIIVVNNDSQSMIYDMAAKAWNPVEAVETPNSANFVQAMSADGSIWVGFGKVTGYGGPYYPVKWVNGVPEKLPTPAKNGMGDDITVGAMARGCSADGSVIYGSVWENFEALIWKSGSVSYVAEELQEVKLIEVKSMFGTINTLKVLHTPAIATSDDMSISSDGKWLSLQYRSPEAVNYALVQNMQPMVYNTETGESILIDNENVRLQTGSKALNGNGIGIADDGTFFYGPFRTVGGGGGITTGYAYDIAAGTSVPTPAWIQSAIGIYTMGDYWVSRGFEGNRTIVGYKMVPNLMGVTYLPWYATTLGVE